MAAQKFSMPTMPFRREVHNGCAIGTSIIIKARPFQDTNKTFSLQLSSAKDIALQVVVPINKPDKLAVCARTNGQFTSEIEKPCHLPYNQPFTLHVRIDTHVVEVYLSDGHIVDFVHRVNPLEIRTVFLEGPLIVDEIQFRPPSGASLDEVPSYEEVAKSSFPISEMANMSISGATRPPPPPSFPVPVPPRAASPPIRPPPPPASTISAAVPPSFASQMPIPQQAAAPPPAGTYVPTANVAPSGKPPTPYPEANMPSYAPPLPSKKKEMEASGSKPPTYGGPQVAQVQPQQPQVVNAPVQQNLPPSGYYPQTGNVPATSPYPPQQVPAASYPTAPPPTTGYPQQTAYNQYPGPNPQPGAAVSAYPGPNPQPGAAINTYPGPNQLPPTQVNTYPGPNPPPAVYPAQYPGSSAAYMPPQVYPPPPVVYPTNVYPSYVAQPYGYGYPYYDDCHVSYCYSPRVGVGLGLGLGYGMGYGGGWHHHHHHC